MWVRFIKSLDTLPLIGKQLDLELGYIVSLACFSKVKAIYEMFCFKLGDSHDAMCEMTFTVCGLAALSLPTLQTVMLYTYNTVHICLF